MFHSRSRSQWAPSRHKMSGFPLPNSSSFSRDTSLCPVVGGTCPCCAPPPSKCELAQGRCLGGACTPSGHCQAWALPGVTQRAQRAGRDMKMLQHSAPQQVEEQVWALSLPGPKCWGPLPAQPMGHLPESAGLCRRNATLAFPAPGGQILMGILPARGEEGRNRTTGLS